MTHPDTAPRPLPRDARTLGDLAPAVRITDPDLAIAPEVYDAAAHLYLEMWTDEDGTDRAHCPRCDRGIAVADFHYTADEHTGLVVAHMIQFHGWTRENTDD